MKRILLITTVSPYPKSVGKRVVLGGLCDYFLNRCDESDFRVLSFDPLPDELASVAYPTLPKPRLLRKLWNIVWHTLIARDKSMQEAFFWSPEALARIDAAVADHDPELVLFDTLRAGQYQASLKRKAFYAVLYLDDLFSVRYDRILKMIAKFPGSTIDAMGNFVHNIPAFLVVMYRAAPRFQRWLLRRERALITRSENVQPSDFNLALLVNAEEVEHLRARANLDNIHTIRPLMTNAKRTHRRTWNGDPTFVFLGSLNLPHNGFSIELFITLHFPKILKLIPNFKLLVVGAHASNELMALAAKYPHNLSLEGFVDDLDQLLATSAGMIAPLVFGSGLKIKVIDALRMGVPVVATEFGSEGIMANGREGLIIETDLDRFGDHCRLLLDRGANAAHSLASEELFEHNYSPLTVHRQYDEYFQRAAA